MSALALGLVLAVLASVALNSSYLMQHAGSATAPAVDPRRPLATMRGLLASRIWTLGAVLGISGWGVHIGALAHAPLSLVQAFVAGGLGLMAPFAARILRQSMTTLEWVSVAAIAAGLVMLSVGLHDPGRHAHPRALALAAFLAIVFGLAAALGRWARSWRAHALGLAGGLLYGAGDTAIKALTGVATAHGPAAVLLSPWLAAAAVATVCAFFAFQRGLQTGRAIPVVVLMTGATTVSSVLAGFVVFGDPLGSTRLLAALHVLAFAVVAVASALLAPATSVAPVERILAEHEPAGEQGGAREHSKLSLTAAR